MAGTYALAGYTPHPPLDVPTILATTGPTYTRYGETLASTGELRPMPDATRVNYR